MCVTFQINNTIIGEQFDFKDNYKSQKFQKFPI